MMESYKARIVEHGIDLIILRRERLYEGKIDWPFDKKDTHDIITIEHRGPGCENSKICFSVNCITGITASLMDLASDDT